MHPVELTWYKFVILLASAIAIGFGIYNIYYFNKIRTEGNCNPVNNSNATTGLWLNIVLVVVAAIAFLWSMFRLIFTGEVAQPQVNKTYNTMRYSPEVPIVSSPVSSPVSVMPAKPPQTQVVVIPSPSISGQRIVSVPSPVSRMVSIPSPPVISQPSMVPTVSLPPLPTMVPSPPMIPQVVPSYVPSPLPLSSPIIVSTAK